jgi:hypothetical protein
VAREEQPGGRGREKREQPHSEQDRPYSEQARPAQLAHPVSCCKHGHPEGRVQARIRVVVHKEVAQGGPGQQQRRSGPWRQHRGEGPERAGLLAEIAAAREVAIMTVSKNILTGGCIMTMSKSFITYTVF